MQAEATAPTPPSSQARRALPTAAADEAGVGRFGDALKAAQGRKETRATGPERAEADATEAEPERNLAVEAPPQQGSGGQSALEKIQPEQPAEAPPPAGEASAILAPAAALTPLPEMLPTAMAEPVAAAASLTPPDIAPPTQPATPPATVTTPGDATPTSTPTSAPGTPATPTAIASAPPGAVMAAPLAAQGMADLRTPAAVQPTSGDAAPAAQAGPSTPLAGDIASGAPTLSTPAPTAPPVDPAMIGSSIDPPARQPAEAPSLPVGATAASTRLATPPPSPPAKTPHPDRPALPMDQSPAPPTLAAEASPAPSAAPIPAPAGIAVRVTDGGSLSIEATEPGLDAPDASRGTVPGPTATGMPSPAETTAQAPTAPDTASVTAAPTMLPSPLVNTPAVRPVRPLRQTPAGQIVPIAIALSLGSEARGSITVSLDPIELGRVDVRVERMGDLATVQVIAERPETLLLLQRDQATLDRALADAGIGEGGRSLAFSLGGEGRGAQAGTQGRARRPTAAMQGITESPAHAADQRGAGRPRALLDIAV